MNLNQALTDINLNQALTDIYNLSTRPDDYDQTDKQRAGLIKEAIKDQDGNFIKAMDLVLLNDPILRNEWNSEASKRSMPLVNYPLFANGVKEDKEGFSRAAGLYDSITSPGGANFIQTTVADFVAQTIDRSSVVLPTVRQFDIQGQGNFSVPLINDFQTVNPVVDGADLPNIVSNLEAGTSSITLNPARLGLLLPLTAGFMAKVSAKNIQTILSQPGMIMSRSIDRQIILGDGSGVNFTGMLQNATTVAFSGDIVESILNASAALRLSGETPKVYLNRNVMVEILKIELNLPNGRTSVLTSNPAKNEMTIAGMPVILTDLIPTTGTAGNRISTVCIGYSQQYYMAVSSQIQISTSKEFNFAKSAETVKAEMLANGKPAFNDAFAKISVTGLA